MARLQKSMSTLIMLQTITCSFCIGRRRLTLRNLGNRGSRWTSERFPSSLPIFQKEQQKRRITGGAHHNMDYLKRLVTTGADARSGQQKTTVLVTSAADRRRIMPNVIMYDFVNTQMCNEIISLNDPALRGHVIEDEYEGVAQLLA
jgi:hypothetical protein